MSSVHSEKGFDLKFGDEDLLVNGAEHVLVAAEDRLGHQVVDPGLDPACVVTLVIILFGNCYCNGSNERRRVVENSQDRYCQPSHIFGTLVEMITT